MKRFYKTLNRLVDKLQIQYPVYVYFTTDKVLKGCWGDVSFTGKSFSIRIVKSSWDGALFTLLHEVAHIKSWDSCNDEKEYHNDDFGRAYALVWRIYCGEE